MRARNLKPGFFKSEQLLKCEPLARILFEGLWCLADRAGRLEDRPLQIKIEILPCDNCDVDALLHQLHDNGLILRYDVSGKKLIQVLTFTVHQTPHIKEKPSLIPSPMGNNSVLAPDKHQTEPIQAPVLHPLNPESPYLNPESSLRETREDFFGKCKKLLVESFSRLKSSNAAEIYKWYEAGYDFETYVKPSVEAVLCRKYKPQSFGYFTTMFEEIIEKKIVPAPKNESTVSAQQIALNRAAIQKFMGHAA